MSFYFISDLHLHPQRPDLTAAFMHFLQALPADCLHLYILGDLFDSWIGDDDPATWLIPIKQALQCSSQCNIPISLMPGNRDCFLGRLFCQQAGLHLLHDPSIIVHPNGQTRILLMHGDSLCTLDKAYMRLRTCLHTPWLRRLLVSLPLSIRQWIARRARQYSDHANQHKPKLIMDVNPASVQTQLQQHQCDWLIHGHTHRPAIHTLKTEHPDTRPQLRVVLGDWHAQGWYFKLSAQQHSLIPFPLDTTIEPQGKTEN